VKTLVVLAIGGFRVAQGGVDDDQSLGTEGQSSDREREAGENAAEP
jgi:hypothetical protein